MIMRDISITNNMITSLRSIESKDELVNELVNILSLSLARQHETKGQDKRNLEELKQVHKMIQENDLNLGQYQQKLLTHYAKSVEAIESVIERASDKDSSILERAYNNIVDSVPALKDITSALMRENPLIGQTWKIAAGTFKFAKDRISKIKEKKSKEKSAIDIIDGQQKTLKEMSENIEDLKDDVVESDRIDLSELEVLSDIAVDIYKIKHNTQHLDELENIIPNSVPHQKDDVDSNIERITDVENNNVILTSSDVVIEKLDDIDEHIMDGIKNVLKFLDDGDKKKEKNSILRRMRDTKTTVDTDIASKLSRNGGSQNDNKHGGIGNLLGGLKNALRFIRPMLVLLTSTVLAKFVFGFKSLFGFIGKMGSVFGKLAPIFPKILGRASVIGTAIFAIYDFVDGIIDSFSIFEDNDNVAIHERLSYALGYVASGFIKLINDVLDIFGLGFLDSETTQEDIAKELFKFRESLLNSIKASINSLLDWLSDLLPDWLVPDFRFDTSIKKFKSDKDQPNNDVVRKIGGTEYRTDSKIFNSVTDTGSSVINETTKFFSDIIDSVIMPKENSVSLKYNQQVKLKEAELEQINRTNNNNKQVINSGNSNVTNINNAQHIHNGGKNTGNPDKGFVTAF